MNSNVSYDDDAAMDQFMVRWNAYWDSDASIEREERRGDVVRVIGQDRYNASDWLHDMDSRDHDPDHAWLRSVANGDVTDRELLANGLLVMADYMCLCTDDPDDSDHDDDHASAHWAQGIIDNAQQIANELLERMDEDED